MHIYFFYCEMEVAGIQHGFTLSSILFLSVLNGEACKLGCGSLGIVCTLFQ